jgi:AraC-like DNA-binding protein
MALGRAKLAIDRGLSVWVLQAPNGFGDADTHAHHAIQLTASLDGDLMITDGERVIEAPAIAVAADAPHRFEARGLLAFLFVEPESRVGRAVSAQLFGDAAITALPPAACAGALAPLRATFDDDLPPEALLASGREALAHFAPEMPAGLPDPRIQKVIYFAHAHLDRPLTLASASEGVFLSPSRLRHLFVEQTGLAFKTYVLWLRLVRALSVYAGGANLTEAAHAAGFADSAHFSRTFKRTFGLPATTLERL